MTHGAYVAKPDAVVARDVPTGWGDWTFPGPWPPGYTPVLTMGVVGADTLVVGENYDSTWTLYDHETYRTTVPTDTITWTATIDDVAIQMKFSGDESFASSLSSAFEDVGSSFYGDAPTIVFDVGAGDIGSTIVLQTSSEAFDGFTVTKTKDILVTLDVWTVELAVVMTPGGDWPTPGVPGYIYYQYGGRIYAHEEAGNWSEPWAFVWGLISQLYSLHPWAYDSGVSDAEDYTVIYSANNLKITTLRLLNGTTYSFDYKHYATTNLPWATTFDYTLKTYKNDVLQDTKTKQVVKAGGGGADSQIQWCTINGSTGAITVVNP